MKVFLSHKMSGVSEEEVYKIRERMTNEVKEMFPDQDIEIIDNYNHEGAPENAGRLWHLGRSIQQLEEADAIYFDKRNIGKLANGVVVEKVVASLYNIKVLGSSLYG